MISMWGLNNCDTCRQARRWLETHAVDFAFHDLRENTPDHKRISRWLKHAGENVLVNRRGTTWRNLPESAKQKIDAGDSISVIEANPSLLKRPIVEYDEQILIGFDTADYQTLFGKPA